MKPELQRRSEVYLKEEDDFTELAADSKWDVVIADDCMKSMLPKFDGQIHRHPAFCCFRQIRRRMLMNQVETRKIRVYGIVQGVGFRPTVSRHAVKNDIHGSVCNKGPYVEIFAQGTKAQVDGFLEDLEKRPPKRAAILKINVEHLDNNPEFDGFEIIESEKTKGEIFVSPVLPFVMNAKRSCMIRTTDAICILLSIVPAAGRG